VEGKEPRDNPVSKQKENHIPLRGGKKKKASSVPSAVNSADGSSAPNLKRSAKEEKKRIVAFFRTKKETGHVSP